MHQKADGERDVPFHFLLIKPVGKPTLEWIMNKILKKAALPALALAAMAYAAPSAHADTDVEYFTTLTWTGAPAVHSILNPLSPVASYAGPTPTGVYVPGALVPSQWLSDSSTSTVTFTSGATIQFHGEHDAVLANSGGVFTTFGGITTTGTVHEVTPISFSINVFELEPSVLGPGKFVGSLTGSFTTNVLGQVLLNFPANSIDGSQSFSLPSSGNPSVTYATTGQFIVPTLPFTPGPGINDQNEIRGDVTANGAPLPKTASVSLALFGLLGAFGLAKRKSLNIA